MRRSTGPFRWENVPKMLILVAGITTAVILFGAFTPGMFGTQSLTFPILCIFAALWWFLVYWFGKRPYPDEPPPASEQETPEDRAAREFAEAQPTRADYLDISESIKERRSRGSQTPFGEILAEEEERPSVSPKTPLGPDHHYDERV